VATHRGHGGPHDAATPGDVLCAALACCHELTIRMLEVKAEGDIDLRGSLMARPGSDVRGFPFGGENVGAAESESPFVSSGQALG
jgi:hypothetical protein